MGPTLLTLVVVLGAVYAVWLSLSLLNRAMVKLCHSPTQEDTDRLEE
jgi:hypothetical protein